jgi:hypothetical protein
MSPARATAAGDLLRPGDPPPLPFHPEKPMLLAAVAGLGELESAEAIRLLDAVLASPDADLREAAVEALGRRPLRAGVRARLIAALDDATARVRGAAARALLAAAPDGAARLDPRERARLEAHARIAEQRWRAVMALGGASLPALALATRDDDQVIRREARWIARLLVRRLVPVGGRTLLAGSTGAIRGPSR